jgi:hypothetical protein
MKFDLLDTVVLNRDLPQQGHALVMWVPSSSFMEPLAWR